MSVEFVESKSAPLKRHKGAASGKGNRTSVGWRLLVWRWWWRRRRREFGLVYRNVLVQLVYLDGEAVAWAGQRPAVGGFYAVGVAVVAVIDLRRQAAQRRFAVANQTQEKTGLRVEIEMERRLVFAFAR